MAAILSTQISPLYDSPSNTVPQATPTTPSVSEVNYLQHSVENITEKTQADHISQGRTHMTVAVAVGVLFAAVVITSIVLTAIFAPASIPIAALGAFCVMPTIDNFISNRITASQASFDNAQQCQDIRNEQDKLPKEEAEFLAALSHKGIKLDDIQDEKVKKDPLLLAPVLAHYNYWHDQAIKFQAASREARTEQREYSGKFPREDPDTKAINISRIRLKSIANHEQSLHAKTNAAFYLGILRNPGFSKEVSKIMQFGTTLDIGGNSERSRIILGERALYSQFSPSEDYFLKMDHSDSSTELLTRRQVLQLSEARLSAKLFA
ncbi:MAG: hypothetical protein NTX49_03310 [Chlamydiae bacterium]|nr:hypothetical protein [Chlamydiota bacterium]